MEVARAALLAQPAGGVPLPFGLWLADPAALSTHLSIVRSSAVGRSIGDLLTGQAVDGRGAPLGAGAALSGHRQGSLPAALRAGARRVGEDAAAVRVVPVLGGPSPSGGPQYVPQRDGPGGPGGPSGPGLCPARRAKGKAG